MSTLPALQNPGRRSLMSYVRRIVRCAVVCVNDLQKPQIYIP